MHHQGWLIAAVIVIVIIVMFAIVVGDLIPGWAFTVHPKKGKFVPGKTLQHHPMKGVAPIASRRRL